LTGIVNWHGEVSWRDAGSLLFYAAVMLALDVPQFLKKDHTTMLHWHWLLRGIAYAAMAVMLAVFYTGRAVPFIYFQF
jgi:hypothetical protein